MRTGGRMDRSNFHHRDLQREIGSTGLNDAFLRDETEPHQACGDGPDLLTAEINETQARSIFSGRKSAPRGEAAVPKWPSVGFS